MKKIFLNLICILLLCGCSTSKDEYSNYKHYDLTGYNHEIYSYLRRTNDTDNSLVKEVYAVSILTSANQEEVLGYDEGVFYQVGKNDYILLDSFSSRSNDKYNKKEYTLLYKNKLYIIRNNSNIVFEYELNRENPKRKDLSFDLSEIMKAEILMSDIYRIEDVDDEYIYFIGSIRGYNGDIPVDDRRGVQMKCSLKDYKCVESK